MAGDGKIIRVGDLVISMLAPGHFRVIHRTGERLELEHASGLRRTVRETNVRLVVPQDDSTTPSA